MESNHRHASQSPKEQLQGNGSDAELGRLERQISQLSISIDRRRTMPVGVLFGRDGIEDLVKQRAELEKQCHLITDERMARSLLAATLTDGAVVSAMLEDERRALRDHAIAVQMEEQEVEVDEASRSVPVTSAESSITDEYLARLAALHVPDDVARGFLQEDLGMDDKSILRSFHHCASCFNEMLKLQLYTAPCGDNYCRGCLQELFTMSNADESLFPPRCCRQPIPVNSEIIALFLTKSQRDQYELRRIEVSTTHRIYCSNTDCAVFIPPSSIVGNVANCSKCLKTTCSGCKWASHTGDCEVDEDLKKTLALAEEQGWRRCSGCQNLVQLGTGCNHITCRCGYEFCYVCGDRWKTCGCDQWDEYHLLGRANQVVDRDVNAPQDVVARAAEVGRVAQELRVGHNCDHPRRGWRFIQGEHECEECHRTLPQYIFECGQCRLRACWRCRMNRL